MSITAAGRRKLILDSGEELREWEARVAREGAEVEEVEDARPCPICGLGLAPTNAARVRHLVTSHGWTAR